MRIATLRVVHSLCDGKPARDGKWETRMDLPEDIRLKIEANQDKETFLEVVNRGGNNYP
jgi:hypothetical protein